MRSPKGLDHWQPGTISNILRNEKYCGDVLYQKTYSKSYLTHKTVKNNSVLPQWFWEGIVPAIIPVSQWQRVQEALGYGRRGKKKTEIIRKKFEFARVKAGVLRGFYYLDPDWSKDEREQPRASSSFCRRSKISIALPPFCIYFTVSNNGKIQYACAE